MIDINKPVVKKVLDNMHNVVKRRMRASANDSILKENRIFACLCNNINYGPSQCANYLNEKYDYSLTPDDIIMAFRQRHIAHPDERKKILRWANGLAELFGEALNGNQDSFSRFELMRRNSPGHHLFTDKERVLAIMIYEKYPELNAYGDREILMGLGRSLATYFLYDFSDALAYGNGFPTYKERTGGEDKNSNRKNTKAGDSEKSNQVEKPQRKLTYDEAITRLQQMEHTLDRTNSLLQELQDEFDEQISASKAQELAEFFSQLNSDKYGCILDELLMVKKGMNDLKKRNYELPIEINGLLIMVRKLIQFVQDSHINPMMKVNSLKEVRASDVEFCNYEGTPFQNEDEIKTVRVISPGWIYKDKELQISRPKLKEEE